MVLATLPSALLTHWCMSSHHVADPLVSWAALPSLVLQRLRVDLVPRLVSGGSGLF